MKKLEFKQMEEINGGLKCIYHGLFLTVGVIFAPWNTGPLAECLKNGHNE